MKRLSVSFSAVLVAFVSAPCVDSLTLSAARTFDQSRSTDTLKVFAAAAKKDRRDSFSAEVHWDLSEPEGGLRGILSTHSVVLVTPTQSTIPDFHDFNTIFRWYRLRLEKTVSKRTVAAPYNCSAQLPSDTALGQDELLLRLVGGTAVVDQISITLTSPQTPIQLRSGARYLMIGPLCGNGFLSLPHDHNDVFLLGNDGLITRAFQGRPMAWVKELLGLRTLDGLVKFINSGGRS